MFYVAPNLGLDTSAQWHKRPSTLVGLVLLAALLPYIKLGPIGLPSEVQAWSALLAWTAIFFFAVRQRLLMNRFHIVILAFSFVFIVYIPFDGFIEIGQYLRKSISFIMSVSIAVIARFLYPVQTLKLLKFATVLWLIFAILGQVAPSSYQQIVTKFVPGALGVFGNRGVTSLAPEATDFGFTMVYFWMLTVLASIASQARGGPAAPTWLYVAIFVNIGLSRAGAGIMAVAVLVLVYQFSVDRQTGRNLISGKSIMITLAVFVVFVIGIMFMPQTGIRGLDLLVILVQTPGDLIQTTTLSYRIVHNMVGFYGLLESYLLGYGAGTFTVLGPELYYASTISDTLGLQGWYRSNMISTLHTSPLATFPVIFFEYGILGVIFVVYIFVAILRSDQPAKYVVAALLFMTWAQSFPVAYPMFWLLLGMHKNPHFSCRRRLTERQDTRDRM